MKTLFFLLLLPLSLHAVTFEEYLSKKKETVSHTRHLPYQLTRGHKTKVSVLLIHGIFSSPLYFKGMAEAFYNAGYNVVTILLPGHWDKDFYSMSKITEKDWSKEAELGFELAINLGDKVILAGHSLGGLLSVELAQKKSRDEVAGLVLISPALKVRSYLVAACRAGTALKISGNQFYRRQPDGIDVPFFAPYGALLIQNLADKVSQKKINAPVSLTYTWNDINVDVPFVREYFNALEGPKSELVYKLNSGISHGDISQSPRDEATFGNHTNPDFDQMMNTALSFLREQGL